MKIAVCIKQVPASTDVKVDPVTGVLIRSGTNNKMNPYDLYAVETALKIKAMIPNTKVYAISMGPAQAKTILNEALWMGCDEAICVSRSSEILKYITDDTDVVAVDEVQFFDDGIVDVLRNIADKNKRVICAGLDMDFRGEPFGPVPKLLAIAEFVDKIQAICMVCGNPATRTQRLIDGKPAKYSDPVVMVGAKEKYEARCRKCHIVPKE